LPRDRGAAGLDQDFQAGPVPEFFADVSLGYTQVNLEIRVVFHAEKGSRTRGRLAGQWLSGGPGGGKGSHRKFVHDRYPGALRSADRRATTPSPTRKSRFAKRWRRFMKTTDSYHKWVEWSEEDGVSIGKCPDLISGIHGADPVRVYADLARVVEEVVAHFEKSGRQLPPPRVRPMQEVG
jgi:hypothetical protein